MKRREVVLWLGAVAMLTPALVVVRDRLDEAHFVLAYLLLVLLCSARAGRGIGLGVATACFVCLNFFLIVPYHTFVVSDPRAWLVLAAFWITSLVAAQLLHRAQSAAAAARARADEIRSLSTLGAETLSAGSAEQAVSAIARVIRETLDIDACDIYVADAPGPARLTGFSARDAAAVPGDPRIEGMFDYSIEHGAAIVRRTDDAVHVLERGAALLQTDARVIVVPLRVHDRTVGLLRLASTRAIVLDESQRRFAEALSYYAALGAERVRLTAEAERAQLRAAADRMKDAVVAAVSHDLRTPLTTIKALAHELGTDGGERAHIIELEADRLNRMVTDLLDISRLNAGELPTNPEINIAEDLLGAALERIAGLPRAGDVTASLPAGSMLAGHFDFVHALRALVNLLENALKYSPEDTIVEVTVAQRDGNLVFGVLDRGPGVSPQDATRLFQPFVRGLHGAGGTAEDGVGLGLAVARGLAAAQGGSVTYAPRPGGGSIFELHLPPTQLPAG